MVCYDELSGGKRKRFGDIKQTRYDVLSNEQKNPEVCEILLALHVNNNRDMESPRYR